ncbi:hypothetical protein MG293_015947 [Ovis ammon polii]|uniref:Uncharacterized protein n=1 Tax=Ovis ammon polii TaxID=230172 RepID=A0AAD4TYL8_OVIAM|nr:hypothetical protein MG293_015947 [Ovis ammon polii]
MITVFRRQRLPACLPVLAPPLQEAGQNIETEFWLLLATPKSYLPAWVPVQSFFVTLRAVAPRGSNGHAVSQQKYWSGLPFPRAADLTHPETRLQSPTRPALQASSSPLSHPDNV